MKNWIFGFLLLCHAQINAETLVTIEYAAGKGSPVSQIEAVVRAPETGTTETGGKKEALILLHHAGGYSFGTTRQYGEFFSKNGYLTLELKMFDTHTQRPSSKVLHGQLMGALKYLSTRQDVDPRKISVMGMSLGAYMAMVAATTWFYEEFEGGDQRFHKLVALYPVCWFMTEALRGQTQGIGLFNDLPSGFLGKWERIPLLMLAAGKDDYDGGKGDQCPRFYDEIQDSDQKNKIRLVVYPDATHGWDHGKTYSFPVRGACIGRSNCMNRNVSNPAIVDRGMKEVLRFLGER